MDDDVNLSDDLFGDSDEEEVKVAKQNALEDDLFGESDGDEDVKMAEEEQPVDVDMPEEQKMEAEDDLFGEGSDVDQEDDALKYYER
jgi:hypothetical protein